MDVQDLKFLFEVIDVKAQSKSTEDPHDANLRRFKDKWLFIITRLYEFFKNAHNINDVAKIQAKNLRNTDESRYPFAQLVDPVVKPRGFGDFFIKSSITLILIFFSFIGWGFFIALRPDSPQLGIVINGGFGLVMALAGYYVRGKS